MELNAHAKGQHAAKSQRPGLPPPGVWGWTPLHPKPANKGSPQPTGGAELGCLAAVPLPTMPLSEPASWTGAGPRRRGWRVSAGARRGRGHPTISGLIPPRQEAASPAARAAGINTPTTHCQLAGLAPAPALPSHHTAGAGRAVITVINRRYSARSSSARRGQIGGDKRHARSRHLCCPTLRLGAGAGGAQV